MEKDRGLWRCLVSDAEHLHNILAKTGTHSLRTAEQKNIAKSVVQDKAGGVANGGWADLQPTLGSLIGPMAINWLP